MEKITEKPNSIKHQGMRRGKKQKNEISIKSFELWIIKSGEDWQRNGRTCSIINCKYKIDHRI